MSRLLMVGYDVCASGASVGPDCPGSAVHNGTRDTTLKRTGPASAGFVATAGGVKTNRLIWTASASATYYIRVYLYFTNLPTAASTQVAVVSNLGVRVKSSGKLALWDEGAAAQIGSDSAVTLTTGVWYRIELSETVNGSSQCTGGELRLDGTTVASGNLATPSGVNIGTLDFGWVTAPAASGTFQVNADDIAIGDSSGTNPATNSWPGDGKVLLMTPTSDNQRGVWTAGTSGTTNLWDAVNNTPPVGVASGSATATSQIESSSTGSQTSANEYQASCGTYLAAGIGASDAVNVVQMWVCHGEEVATGTKTLLMSGTNPVISVSANAGNDAGAEGTYPTLWFWSFSSFTETAVTKGSNFIAAVRRTDSGTRLADVCFMGLYVDYTPAAPSAKIAMPIIVGQAVNRAASY